MVGPSWRASTWRSRATSAASEDSGNWGAVTLYPSACRRSMTALKLEPSAHAPWTRTIFGRALISGSPRIEPLSGPAITVCLIVISPLDGVGGADDLAHPPPVGGHAPGGRLASNRPDHRTAAPGLQHHSDTLARPEQPR